MPNAILTACSIPIALVIGAGATYLILNDRSPAPAPPAPLPSPTPPATTTAVEAMTVARLAGIIRGLDPGATGVDDALRFDFQSTKMACYVDEPQNRMRVIAPIGPADELTDAQRDATLGANYKLALDARYAVGDGVLYAVYVHPLDSLTEAQLRQALPQVTALVKNFDTTYAATHLRFGP
ncbi:MAG: hypothetical protein ACYTGQ_14835 [Planctomycetota bacterium]|jgi:hypothetical protein